jgi:hypothetical protein
MERFAVMAIGHSDPIILPGRKPLITLRDAVLYSRNCPRQNTMPKNGKPQYGR